MQTITILKCIDLTESYHVKHIKNDLLTLNVNNIKHHHRSAPPFYLRESVRSTSACDAWGEWWSVLATWSDQRCPINGLHAKMKSNTGVQRGHLSPFIYVFDQIVPANICLCPPYSLPPVTDGGKSLVNGDAITPQPVRAEGESGRRRKKRAERYFSAHY